MLLSNPFFDADEILNQFSEIRLRSYPKGLKPLDILQKKLKQFYFDDGLSYEQIKIELQGQKFLNFSRLQYVLQQIFEGNENIVIPSYLMDSEPNDLFKILNDKYGYFDVDLSYLYQKISINSQKMAVLIENQRYDNEMPYKLMVLFFDSSKDQDKNFKLISEKFDKLIRTQQDHIIKTPYHDALVVSLNAFPKYSQVIDLPKWKEFIVYNGFNSLQIFSECATQSTAFENMKQAQLFLLKKSYPSAEESPELAKICKEMLISNKGFDEGLKFIKSGWPKKYADNLPIVDISDDSEQFYWVKLPPQDMRAMYLGNVIPGCCQFINGHSRQCVVDGITLSDNGFYVLLKAKHKNLQAPRLKNNQINTDDYAIVAQSYAWITYNENLCLDSIEWNRSRVNIDVLKSLLNKFAEKIFREHPQIKYLNVGKGGQTPSIFPDAFFMEQMKQGVMYGDASKQYCIASCLTSKPILSDSSVSEANQYKNYFLYLQPYFNNVDLISSVWASMDLVSLSRIPNFLQKIKFPVELTADDLQIISLEQYQSMNEMEQSKISTIRKIFSSTNEEMFLQWLPTIPVEDLHFINKKGNSIRFITEIIKRLGTESSIDLLKDFRVLLWEKDVRYFRHCFFQVCELIDIQNIFEALKPTHRLHLIGEQGLHCVAGFYEKIPLILKLLPPEHRLEVNKIKNADGESLILNPHLDLESIQLIWDSYSEEEKLQIIQEKNHLGRTILYRALYKPDLLESILAILQNNSIVELEDCDGNPVIYYACSHLKSLQLLLERYSPHQRFEVLNRKYNHFGSIFSRLKSGINIDLIRMIFTVIPHEYHFDILQVKDYLGGNIFINRNLTIDQLIEVLNFFSPEERVRVVTLKDKYRESILLYMGEEFENLKKVLEKIPLEFRHDLIKENFWICISCANNANRMVSIFELIKPEERMSILKINIELFSKIIRDVLLLIPKEQMLEMVRLILTSHSLLTDFHNVQEYLKQVTPEQYNTLMKNDQDYASMVLTQAIDFPESLKFILSWISPEIFVEILKHKNEYGKAPIEHALLYPSTLKIILETIEYDYKLYQDLIFRAGDYPDSLKVILDIISPEKLADLFKDNEVVKRILSSNIDNPNLFKTIFSLVKVEDQWEMLKGILNSIGGVFVFFRNSEREKLLSELVSKAYFIFLKNHQFDSHVIEYIESLEHFKHEVKYLVSPETVDCFINCLIHKNIKEAKQILYQPDSGFFAVEKQNKIEECVEKLHPFWKKSSVHVGEYSSIYISKKS